MFLKKKLLSLLLMPVLAVFMLGADGCFKTPPPSPTDGPKIPDPPAYILKAGDPIAIQFSGANDLVPVEKVIDEKGEIGLLHIDRVKASGLTTSELEEKIETLYVEGKIYKSISVSVTMTAKTFYVQGEVNSKQGQFQLSSGTTLSQAIAAAGGYTPFADERKIKVRRGSTIIDVNMKDVEDNPLLDVAIEAGDVIYVPEKWY